MIDPAVAERFDKAFGPGCWAIDDATIDGGTLSIRGWALAPAQRIGDVTFTVNGRPFEHLRYGLERDDLARLLWYRADAAHGGFECSTPLTPGDLAADMLLLQFADRAAGQPFVSHHAYRFPMVHHAEAQFPIPDGPRMHRTTGSESVPNFRLTGLTTAAKIRDVVTEMQRDFARLSRVLDWGCGCGRIARFCSDWPGFTGADIDADNAAWCGEHLPFGCFEAIGLFPPTPFPDRQFDLIFGISVMTHLAEEVQQEWLAELHRVGAPYGIVLLTTLGEHAAVRAGLTPEAFKQFVAAGSAFYRTEEAIDDALGSPGYYGTTFMTHEQIRRNWSRWFSVDRIIPAYIGNHQDLVVLRRR